MVNFKIIHVKVAEYMRQSILVATVILSLGVLANSQTPSQIKIVGRVVDREGDPVEGASVYLEPEKWTGGFDRFVEAVSSTKDGTFTVEKPKPNNKFPWRLFVVLDRTEANYYNPLEPPFGLLAQKNRLFKGRRVYLQNYRITNLGDIPIQHQYGSVELDVSRLEPASADRHTFPWKNVSLRIRDKKRVLANDVSISVQQLSKSVGKGGTVLLMSLPQGIWSVEILLRSKIIGTTGRFSVTSKNIRHVDLKELAR